MLFVSAIVLASWSGPTMWHNAVVAIGLFAAALFDGHPEPVRRERELYGRTDVGPLRPTRYCASGSAAGGFGGGMTRTRSTRALDASSTTRTEPSSAASRA